MRLFPQSYDTPAKKLTIKTEFLADSIKGLRFQKPTNVPAKLTSPHKIGLIHNGINHMTVTIL